MSDGTDTGDSTIKVSKAAEEQKSYTVIKADPSRKRITAGRKRAPNRIPDEILNNPDLAADMAILPSNYNFEVGLRGRVWVQGGGLIFFVIFDLTFKNLVIL